MKKRDPPPEQEKHHPSEAGPAEDRFPEDTRIRLAGFVLIERRGTWEPQWYRVGEWPQLRYTQSEAAAIARVHACELNKKPAPKKPAYFGQE